MSEMVLDGGGHFIPAGIFGLHTLSYYYRPRQHMTVPRKLPEHIQYNTIEHTKRGYSTSLDSDVLTPSPCE